MIKRAAFTLIELVFVIVILGIMGLISFDVIFRVYENFTIQRDVLFLQQQSSRILQQLDGYFSRAITVSMRVSDRNQDIFHITRTQGDINTTAGRDLLWIDRDIEVLRGVWDAQENENYPAFSGWVNVATSENHDIIVFDSNLSQLNEIVTDTTRQALFRRGGNEFRSALYFSGSASNSGTTLDRFWAGSASGSLFGIRGVSEVDNNFSLEKNPADIGEKGWVVSTSMGLQLTDDGDLFLVDNFRSWNDTNNTIDDGDSHLLAKNVDSLTVYGSSAGNLIRMELCLQIDINNPDETPFCKEGMVLR